jgi:hypothetical protein
MRTVGPAYCRPRAVWLSGQGGFLLQWTQLRESCTKERSQCTEQVLFSSKWLGPELARTLLYESVVLPAERTGAAMVEV